MPAKTKNATRHFSSVRFSQLIRACGLSHQDTADLLGVAVSTITKWTHGGLPKAHQLQLFTTLHHKRGLPPGYRDKLKHVHPVFMPGESSPVFFINTKQVAWVDDCPSDHMVFHLVIKGVRHSRPLQTLKLTVPDDPRNVGLAGAWLKNPVDNVVDFAHGDEAFPLCLPRGKFNP